MGEGCRRVDRVVVVREIPLAPIAPPVQQTVQSGKPAEELKFGIYQSTSSAYAAEQV